MLPTTEIKHAPGWEDRYNPKTGKMEVTYVGFPDDFDKDSDEENPDNRFFTNKIMKPNHDVFTKCLHYFMDSLKKKEKKIIE